MVQFDEQKHALVGAKGSLAVLENDHVAHKLVMLISSPEGTALSQPRRPIGMGAPASVSETNVAQPWGPKVVDHQTPKGWP